VQRICDKCLTCRKAKSKTQPDANLMITWLRNPQSKLRYDPEKLK
jgi:hypothetical protein